MFFGLCTLIEKIWIGLDCEMGWDLFCFLRLFVDDILSYVVKRLCFWEFVL